LSDVVLGTSVHAGMVPYVGLIQRVKGLEDKEMEREGE
jgi:hypothetical protein